MWIESSEKKYKILKELGKGHSGSVLLGEDPQGHKVAIKCLSRQYNDAALKRFRREFVILHSLVHPNIAQPFDFGYDERLKRYYFVAEYVHGETLNIALKKAGPEESLEMFSQALQALNYIHRQGVYHCDLKPANILVTSRGVVKLIDFDVASRGTQAIGGTPAFLPPELSGDLKSLPNPRTDLYSLGVTFYYCLTGQKPYPAKTFQELKRIMATVIPKLPTELNPKLKPFWDGVLMGLIQKNPSQRFSTASAALQQVQLQQGAKKNLLSVEDVEYRLAQHGLPIAKDEILEEAKSLLSRGLSQVPLKDKIWVVEGEAGAGITYLMEELKTLSQIEGVPAYTFGRNQENFPSGERFAWLLDDLRDSADAETPPWSARLREIIFKGDAQEAWVVLGGISRFKRLPKDLQTHLKDNCRVFRLKKWAGSEAKSWMEDIFQTPSLPPFLQKQILDKGEGNPKRYRELLRQYLERGLLLDRGGNWRKDLFQPTPLFVEEFLPEASSTSWERVLERVTPLEKEILGFIALFREPIRVEFLEKWFAREDVFPAVQRLAASRWVGPEGGDEVQILDPGLKNYLLNLVGPEELKSRHDLILAHVQREPAPQLSATELHFHMARGSDPERSAAGWAFFGEDCARKALWESAFEYYTNAFEIVPASAVEQKFEYSVARGRCLIQRNLLKEARTFFSSLLVEFAEQRHNRPEIFAKIFERLGVIETKLGEFDRAREYFYQGLNCLDPSYEPLEQYLAIRNFLAGLDLQQGNFESAIEEYRETHECALEKLPFERRRILTNNDLGAALLKAGRFAEAVGHWSDQIPDLEGREDKNPLVRLLFQLGQAHQAKGELAKAREYLERAMEEAEDLQNFEISLRIYNSLANLHRNQDDEQALHMYEKALDAAFNAADTYSTAIVLLNMGFLLEGQGQFSRSKHCLLEGLNYLRELAQNESRFRFFFHSTYLALSRTSAELLQPQEALAFAKLGRGLIAEKAAASEELFETLLALWQAETLNGLDADAKLSAAALKKLATSKERKAQLKQTESRIAHLQIQWRKARKSSPAVPAPASPAMMRTQTTHILAIQSASAELDSSR